MYIHNFGRTVFVPHFQRRHGPQIDRLHLPSPEGQRERKERASSLRRRDTDVKLMGQINNDRIIYNQNIPVHQNTIYGSMLMHFMVIGSTHNSSSNSMSPRKGKPAKNRTNLGYPLVVFFGLLGAHTHIYIDMLYIYMRI